MIRLSSTAVSAIGSKVEMNQVRATADRVRVAVAVRSACEAIRVREVRVGAQTGLGGRRLGVGSPAPGSLSCGRRPPPHRGRTLAPARVGLGLELGLGMCVTKQASETGMRAGFALVGCWRLLRCRGWLRLRSRLRCRRWLRVRDGA